MALTLTEAGKLSNDMLLQGVVETIVKDSPILQKLPFIEIVGNGLTYTQDSTVPCPGTEGFRNMAIHRRLHPQEYPYEP